MALKKAVWVGVMSKPSAYLLDFFGDFADFALDLVTVLGLATLGLAGFFLSPVFLGFADFFGVAAFLGLAVLGLAFAVLSDLGFGFAAGFFVTFFAGAEVSFLASLKLPDAPVPLVWIRTPLVTQRLRFIFTWTSKPSPTL